MRIDRYKSYLLTQKIGKHYLPSIFASILFGLKCSLFYDIKAKVVPQRSEQVIDTDIVIPGLWLGELHLILGSDIYHHADTKVIQQSDRLLKQYPLGWTLVSPHADCIDDVKRVIKQC